MTLIKTEDCNEIIKLEEEIRLPTVNSNIVEERNLTFININLMYCLCIIPSTWSANILFLHPFHSKSHANFNDAISKSLLKAGHQVTVFTGFSDTIKHVNYTAVDYWRPELPRGVVNFVPVNAILGIGNSFKFINEMTNSSAHDCACIMHLKELQQILKSKEKLFDLLIIDIMVYSFECFLPISEILNVPVIGTIPMRSWRNIEWTIGNPYNPADTPLDFTYSSHKIDFIQRLKNTWDCILDMWHYKFVVTPTVDQFYQNHFLTAKTRKKLSLLFVNGHSAFNSRTLLPNVINLGGIHVPSVKPLPKGIQDFMDTAEHGVILLSMGSILQSHKMPAKALSVFLRVFAQLPQRVIWKTEGHIESLSDNILLSNWIPQRDILDHKNMVAFISHAGLSGIYEALFSGVPMILIPTFLDQMSNAAILDQLGLGINIELSSITTEILKDSLDRIINDTQYRERLKRISMLMTDQPVSPSKAVVYWTEYVLRHNGTPHLDAIASSLPLYQYLLLDVIGFVFVVIFATCFGIYYLLQHVHEYIYKKTPSPINIKIHQ